MNLEEFQIKKKKQNESFALSRNPTYEALVTIGGGWQRTMTMIMI